MKQKAGEERLKFFLVDFQVQNKTGEIKKISTLFIIKLIYALFFLSQIL